MRKRLFFAACLLAAIAFASQVAPAQDAAPESAQGARGWPSPEEVVGRLDSKLGLSDDQKAKITPIIAERQQKMKALAADNSGRRRQKMRKMKSIMSESDAQIRAVLTGDQKQKYTEMQQQMRDQARQRMRDRQSGGGQPQ